MFDVKVDVNTASSSCRVCVQVACTEKSLACFYAKTLYYTQHQTGSQTVATTMQGKAMKLL
jgi:hypothetical protein